MRLIDADALVTKYGDYYVEEGPEEGFIGTLKSLIDMQPTVEDINVPSKWISVKDRLPPNADHPGAFCPRYLVCTDFGITVGWYNPDKGKWYGCGWWMYDTNRVADVDFERGDIPKRVVLPVEAWMPLPKAPEVKQK